MFEQVEVRQLFDEARSLAACRVLIEQRDTAKGEYIDAVLALGHQLIQVRRAVPGASVRPGQESYSPTFLAFIEKLGIHRATATRYMSQARDPRKLDARRKAGSTRNRLIVARANILKEML